jgi:putative nucleotidyltransferase with HDIG domain
VSSLRTAVSLIGAETVRSLTLSIHVFSQFDRHSSAAAYLSVLWEHSVAVASLAQRIAHLETGSKSMAEECFTAGLLHDVGKIVLIAEMPVEYRKVIAGMETNTHTIRTAEMEFVGCSHEQVGAYLMSVWGLPPSIVQAVQFHHAPSEAAPAALSALTIVHCADAVASDFDKSSLNHDMELDTTHLEALGLSDKVGTWRGLHEESLSASGEHAGKQNWNVFSS